MSPAAADPAQLEQAYEALRAQATGRLPGTTPRGLALFLSRGLPAWLVATKTPQSAPPPPRPVTAGRISAPGMAGPSVELVRLLAEMVLGGQRRYPT